MSRTIPEWLAPWKNQWLSKGGLQKIVALEGRPFTPWLQEVAPRLRQITEPSKNRTGPVTRYLVKHLWAMSLAHQVVIIPTEQSSPVEVLRQEIDGLRRQLAYLENHPIIKVVEVDRTGNTIDLLRLLATSTEARPHPGVYFLVDSFGHIAYVGQSKNVLARMAGHHDKQFTSVKMIHVKDDKRRLEVEGKLIAIFTPRLNKNGLGFRRETTAEIVGASN